MECRTLEEWQKRTRTPEEYAHFTASEKFMDQIEFLDAQIADAKSDKPRHRCLMQTRSIVCQEFARHLDVGRRKRLSEPFFSKGDKMAYTTLKVVGTPSKQGRPQAHDWLASRGIVWEGDARTLRKELRKALDEGDAPENYFGLRIERTVEICGPERAPRRLSPYYNGQAAAFADKSDPDYFEF